MKDVAQFIIVRKDVQMSHIIFATQIADSSHQAALKCIVDIESNIYKFSNKARWYKAWATNKKFQRHILGADNEDHLMSAFNKLQKISDDIPMHVSRIDGYSSDNPKIISCLSIGPCEISLVRPVLMHYQGA